MIEVPCLQKNNETVRTFGRRNRTVLGKGPKTVLIGQNLLCLAGNCAKMIHFHSELPLVG